MRGVEPLDVVHSYIIPLLAHYAERVQQHDAAAREAQAAATQAADDEGTPAAAHASSVAATAAEASGRCMALGKAEQQHVMQLLAFPLAAGLLDADLQDSSNAAATLHQHHQHGMGAQQPITSSSNSAAMQRTPLRRSLFVAGNGTDADACSSSDAAADAVQQQQQPTSHISLLSRLAHTAVIVTAAGDARLVKTYRSSSSSNSSAGGSSSSSVGHAATDVLYLPKQLGNPLDLQATFPAYDWTLVNPAYAATCLALVSADKWCQLFQALGVQQFLPLQQVSHELTWKQLLTDRQWQHWTAAAEQLETNVRYVIQDWQLPCFEQLLADIQADSNAASRQKQLRVLCSMMVGLWPKLKAARQLEATYHITTASRNAAANKDCSSSGDSSSTAGGGTSKGLSAAAASWRPGTRRLPSSVLLLLQHSAWLLASDGSAHVPSDLFLDLSSIKQLYQQKVQYVGPGCELPWDMAVQLGVSCDTSVATVLKVLTGWSRAAAEPAVTAVAEASSSGNSKDAVGADASQSASEAAGFVTCLADMGKIYYNLWNQIGDIDIANETGFRTLDQWEHQQQQEHQQQEHDGETEAEAIPHDVVLKLLACRAFSDEALIWLPDISEVKAAAVKAAAEAAAAQNGAAGWGGTDAQWAGPAGVGRVPGQRHPGAATAGRYPTLCVSSSGSKEAAAAVAAAAVPDDVMYDAKVMSSLQRVQLHGR